MIWEQSLSACQRRQFFKGQVAEPVLHNVFDVVQASAPSVLKR